MEIIGEDRMNAKLRFDDEASWKLVQEAAKHCQVNEASKLDLSNHDLLQLPQIIQVSHPLNSGFLFLFRTA